MTNATVVDAFAFAEKVGLVHSKSNLNKLNIDKLNFFLTGWSSLEIRNYSSWLK